MRLSRADCGMPVLFAVTAVRLAFPALSAVGDVLVGGPASGLGHFHVSDVDRACWPPALGARLTR